MFVTKLIFDFGQWFQLRPLLPAPTTAEAVQSFLGNTLANETHATGIVATGYCTNDLK
jgi:hypothetical protein